MFLIQNLALSLTDKKLDDYSSSTLDFYGYVIGKYLIYLVLKLTKAVIIYYAWIRTNVGRLQ